MPPLAAPDPFEWSPPATHDLFARNRISHLAELAELADDYQQSLRELFDLWERVAFHMALLEGTPGDPRPPGASADYLNASTVRYLNDLLTQLPIPAAVFDRPIVEARTLLAELTAQLARAHPPATQPSLSLTPDQTATLNRVMRRIDLFEPGVQPTEVLPLTGLHSRSRVYKFLYGRREWVAKFDEPDRARAEWQAVESLRRVLSPDPPDSANPLAVVACRLPENRGGVVLPVADNHVGDGVIVSAAAAHPATAENIPLFEYLTRHAHAQPPLGRAALGLAGEVLERFHSSAANGHEDSGGGVRHIWANTFFRELNGQAAAGWANAVALWPHIDWVTDEVTFDRRVRSLPNPFTRYAAVAAEPTGRLRVSRVHGDTNLGNLLVSVGDDQSPLAVWLIDLAEWRERWPTAWDFAWMELNCWRSLPLHLHSHISRADLPQLTAEFIDARLYLDGATRTQPTLQFIPPGVIDCVRHIRRLAAAALRHPDAGRSYVLKDYFHCLAFAHLRVSRHPPPATGTEVERAQGEWQLRSAVVGSAASFDAIAAVAAGHYGTGVRARPWEDPP